MKILVTGAAGFAGRHLLRELAMAGHEPVATDSVPSGTPATADLPGYVQADLRDAPAMRALVSETKPDAAVHLAAVSYVPDSDRDPSLALSVNIAGTLNVADALREAAPKARLLFISSSQVYGAAAASAPGASQNTVPLKEDSPMRPLSLYAITKAAAETALLARAEAHGQDIVIARPGNHTGPGQSPKFVAPAFASQIVQVAVGRTATVRVGNLDSVRDFSDVRDIVHAYRLLLERGHTQTVYNVTCGTRVRIGDLLARLEALAGVTASVAPDPALWRPADVCAPLDTSRLRVHTGWMPACDLGRTLSDLLSSLRPAGDSK